MVGALISPASVVRSLVATVVLLVVAIVLAYGLGAFGFLRLVNWTILLAGVAVGLFLVLRAKRLLAGSGAIVMTASRGDLSRATVAAAGYWRRFRTYQC
jgi:hypothetical protein